MTRICPYCCKPITGTVSVEHVIPQEIGGNLEIRTCEPCNNTAGKFVDNPVLRWPPVATRKARYDVRNLKRPRRRARSEIVGTLSVGGGKTIWSSDGQGSVFRQVEPADPVMNADGTLTFIVPEENAQTHLRAAIERYQAANPGMSVALHPGDGGRAHPTFEHAYGIAPWIWPRFAAKVATALGTLCMPAEWHRSEPAGMLVGLFRTGKTYKGMFPAGYELGCFPQELDGSDEAPDLLQPHEHLLWAEPVSGGMSFGFVLFGELRFGIRVATDLEPADGAAAWVLDGCGSPTRERLDALFERLEQRRDRVGGMRQLRPEPARRFVGQVHHADVN